MKTASAVVLCLLLTLAGCKKDESNPAAAAQTGVTQIVFDSDRTGNPEIFAMKPDGTSQQQLTNATGVDYDPAWIRDGSGIVFISNRYASLAYEVFKMSATGTGVTQITNFGTGGFCDHPDVSPDGSKIVFKRYTVSSSSYDIYLVNIDGLHLTLLTSSGHDNDPRWSPNGQTIVFSSSRSGTAQIFTMAADGTNQQALTQGAGDNYAPCFSKDGSKIVFVSTRDGDKEIFIMDASGANQQQLTSNTFNDDAPYCASLPAGEKILFASDRDGDYEVFVMDMNGANQQQLTSNTADDNHPSY